MRELSILIIILSTLMFNAVNAQKESVTAATATKEKGYTVLNKGEGTITIYKYQHRSHSPKETEKYVPTYFFITASSAVLQPLTKDNLKKAFPDNHAFHDAIDATFRSDEELHNYDNYHKMYKLNWLLKEHS